MPNRQYNFELPHTIEGWKLKLGLAQYRSDPVYNRIPANLRAALEQGEATGQDVQIRKKDLDRLPDDVWDYIRRTLGLR
jgi:hypothetical protein